MQPTDAAASSRHAAAAPVEAVRQGIHLVGLSASVGPEVTAAVIDAAEVALGAFEADASLVVQLQALYSLAHQCIHLVDVWEPEDVSWSYIPVEALANSIGAFAVVLDTASHPVCVEAIELFELLSLDLDNVAPYLFEGLCRSNLEAESRLLRALQGVCFWIFKALSCVVSCSRFTGAVFWEWASQDASWVVVLCRGALATTPDDLYRIQTAAGGDAVVLPTNLSELQAAVLAAMLDLASPSVIFQPEASSQDGERSLQDFVPIEMRSAELSLHRAELAVAVMSFECLGSLVKVSACTGARVGPQLARFLVHLLQPDLVNPAWETLTETTEATVRETRQASSMFASHLEEHMASIWRLLLGVPGAFGGELPRGFLQDCAALAYISPPSERDYHELVSACLSCRGAAGEPSTLAALVILACHVRALPDEGDALAVELASAAPEVRTSAAAAVAHWKGQRPPSSWLQQWQEVIAPSEPHEPPPEEEPSPRPVASQEAPLPPPKGAVLGSLLRDAPAQFCCQLDGNLMMDPVQTPYGHVADRAAIARALLAKAGVCPLSGQALAVEQCQRLPDLRKQIQVWVRQHRGGGRVRDRAAASAAAARPAA